jgi:hypothetical protein
MSNKIFNDSEVVVFDEKGNLIQTSAPKPGQERKLEKDLNATAMFETHELAGNKIKSVWYKMLTPRQTMLLLVASLLMFFVFVALIKHQVKKSNEKYNKAVQSRIERGCKYPTMVIQGPKEGYSPDPDEGCSPE